MPGDIRLQNLAVAQVILGGIAVTLAPIELNSPLGLGRLLIVPLFASALGQAVLLSIWGVASTVSPWVRMAGLVVGAAYLESMVNSRLGEEFLGVAAVTVVVTTASLLVVRALGGGFTQRAENSQAGRSDTEGLRFSIRGLMVFTAAVALLCAGARGLQANPARFVLLVTLWALCFVAVGFATLWAAMGEVRPQRRWPVVFALSPALGVLFAYAVDAHLAGWVYIILSLFLFSVNLFMSLLVVRSCGYRFVRRAETSPDQASGGGLDDGEPSPFGRPASRVAAPE
ncbi:hypothetical protein [Singulisphaera acidiphila]|uniref:Uncharacterized protein n=1 Tax=Singulisphaera acidiphila (strain ATCC BAA-1392 / DSM 18658 / VKM B-2454 / MOB10) TaxID=886293 RepID=L0DG28_SINAD|nr:hypothetical protein [Singulisphaera acidiphila]AGA28217.1 hypothetical protein Sinac_3993 [Singulisphaera acidiphila DSM 18658]